jgi:fatty acid desaturase
VRQLLGAANLGRGRLFHIMAGNLSFQIEHHLFPDVPSNRYQEISPRAPGRSHCRNSTNPRGEAWARLLLSLCLRVVISAAHSKNAKELRSQCCRPRRS